MWPFLLDHRVYCCVYTLICFFCCIPLTRDYADLPFIIWAVWGIVVIAYDFFTARRMSRGGGCSWLLLFLVANAVSVLLNRDHALYTGAVGLLINGVLLLVVYFACVADDPRERVERFLYHFNQPLIVLSTAASAISLGMYITHVSFTIQSDNVIFRQGVWENRLFGVFTSPNTGAMFTIIAVVAVLVNSLIKRGSMLRWGKLGTACIVLGAAYFSVTLSRGGWLSLGGLLVSIILFCLVPSLRSREEKQKRWKLIVLPVLLAVTVVGGILLLRQVVFHTPDAVNIVGRVLGAETDLIQKKPGRKPSERIEDETLLTSARVYIWRGALAVWKQVPLFGLADADVVRQGASITDRITLEGVPAREVEELEHARGNLHNVYFEVLLCGGLVGFLLMLAWALHVVRNYITCLAGTYSRRKTNGDDLLIGLLFSLVTALVLHGLVEANLLFSGRNVYAAVFWLYAGTGLALAEKRMREQDGGAKALFLCNTPYQVLQAIRLVEGDADGCRGQSDIYIYNRFAQADEISERLRQTDLFCRVYRFRGFAKGFSHDEYPRPLRLCLAFCAKLFPETFLRMNCASGWRGGRGYEKIYLSVFGAFSDPVKLMNPDAEVIQFEDGLGSYVVGDWNGRRSGAFRALDRILFAGHLTYRPTRLYLNCPELCPPAEGLQLCRIPRRGDNQVLKKVFGYRENTVYRDNRMVYLAQPRGDDAHRRELGEKEQKLFDAMGSQIVVRIHPRADAADYVRCHVDEYGNLWELECAEQITDDHVLIGRFSTAQFTPKMLLDKEPTVVVILDELGIPDDRLERFLTAMRGMYRDPERICTVRDYGELAGLIHKWRKE